MNKKTLITTLTLIATVAFAGTAFAQGPGRGHGRGHRMFRHLEQLGLSAEQSAQIQELRQQHRAQVAPFREQMRNERRAMRELWQSDAPDRAAIIAQHNVIAEIREQMAIARIDLRLAVFQLLTAEQRSQLRDMRGRGNREGRGRHGGRGRGRGGRGQWGGGGGPMAQTLAL